MSLCPCSSGAKRMYFSVSTCSSINPYLCVWKRHTRMDGHTHTDTRTLQCDSVLIIISGNFSVPADSRPLLPSEQFIWSAAGSESDSTALGTPAAAAADAGCYLIVKQWEENKGKEAEGKRERGRKAEEGKGFKWCKRPSPLSPWTSTVINLQSAWMGRCGVSRRRSTTFNSKILRVHYF